MTKKQIEKMEELAHSNDYKYTFEIDLFKHGYYEAMKEAEPLVLFAKRLAKCWFNPVKYRSLGCVFCEVNMINDKMTEHESDCLALLAKQTLAKWEGRE